MRTLKATVTAAMFLFAIACPLMAQEKGEEPKFDRETFKKSAMSIARPDLMACRNSDAQITQGSDVNIDAFARNLHGTWVNRDNRTMNGAVMETDAVLFVDMSAGRSGSAILIDRVNLGHPLTDAVLAQATTAPAVPQTISFVHCGLQFVDQYVKVSDQVLIKGLAIGTKVSLPTTDLREAWGKLVAAGYFNSFTMRTSGRQSAVGVKVSPVEGDGARVAFTSEGLKVTEKAIQEGAMPGAENNLPAVIGGMFKTSVAPQTGGGRAHQAANMRWDGEYRGVGVAIPAGSPIYGIEQGIFASEGSSYVAANRVQTTTSPSGETTSINLADGYATSECGDKAQFVAAASNPNAHTMSQAPKASEASTSANQTILAFDRVIIGRPGGPRMSAPATTKAKQ